MPPVPTELRQRSNGPLPADPNITPEGDNDGPLANFEDGTKVIGISGKWYDITNFMKNHPGGPVIEQFEGQDATQVYFAYGHKESYLKHRKVVGTYKMKERHPIDKEIEELIPFFKENGFYDTDWWFYAKKMSVVALLYATVFFLVIGCEQWYLHYLAGVVLAFFWQQCGFIMHEFMHIQMTKNRFKDRLGGLFFGTVCFGMSAHWWQDEHIYHHAMTNVVDAKSRFVDPQMWESIWAQNTKLFPLFKGYFQYFAIKIQHFTFVPMVTFIGRLEILTDGYRLERRWYEWIAIVLHWTWMIFLLSHFPTWKEMAIFYAIAASVEGSFHFQLILSHYCRAFLTKDDFMSNSWYEYQALSNLNIDCPTWMDWYYGGLNYHIEHHLFPRMARNKLREAGGYVKKLCDKHNIEYGCVSLTRALIMTLQHLKKTGDLYTLDPR